MVGFCYRNGRLQRRLDEQRRHGTGNLLRNGGDENGDLHLHQRLCAHYNDLHFYVHSASLPNLYRASQWRITGGMPGGHRPAHSPYCGGWLRQIADANWPDHHKQPEPYHL